MDAQTRRLRGSIDQVAGAREHRPPLRYSRRRHQTLLWRIARGRAAGCDASSAGISSYEPTELVVTARAGTPLLDLEAALAEHGQCLPFEPPRFAPGGTVGGMVAAGLSGPARASVGSVRDHVLGVTLLNGRSEILTFGGQVTKNVAGYDVSRLLVGSLGILGIICEVSLKVLPASVATETLCFAWDEAHALETLSQLGRAAAADQRQRLARRPALRASGGRACRRRRGLRTAGRERLEPSEAKLGG